MSEDNKKGTKVGIKMVVKSLGPPVRKRTERLKLNGYTCKECEDYHKSKGLSEEQLKTRLKSCSRHRAEYSPPKSPEHYWETKIPSTPELIRRGYFKVEERPKRKKKNSDKHLFEAKNRKKDNDSNDSDDKK